MRNAIEKLANRTLTSYGFENWRTILIFKILEWVK